MYIHKVYYSNVFRALYFLLVPFVGTTNESCEWIFCDRFEKQSIS